jgi:methylase of polypeptide subunit release factors
VSRDVQSERQLVADPESLRSLCSILDSIGYDLAQQSLRPDYFTSPFAHYDSLLNQLSNLDPPLAQALRLLALAEPVESAALERSLGRAFVEAGVASGLLIYEPDTDSFSTGGYTLVSLLGQYFIVSTNPYYPQFNPKTADVYFGPDSLTLVHHLRRRADAIASTGRALDLCTGSGIAAISLAAVRRGLAWTAVDLSKQAVEAAEFNAALNGVSGRFAALQGGLFEPVQGERFSLIVANPPFIPVPDGVSFPRYGAGGEDGLGVMRHLINGLPAHLTPSGRAFLYAEGVGDSRGPFVLRLLEELAAAGLAIGVTLIATMPVDQALYTLGLMLSQHRPSRLEELPKWKEIFDRQGVTRYDKFLIEIRPGAGGLVVNSVVGRVGARIAS